jgi:hypothetical protein
MITDDDVFRLFVEADPARDEPTRSFDLAGDLAALRTRSNAVTIIETELNNEPAIRRRWPVYAVAAAVIALIVGGLVFSAREDDTDPTPATEPTIAPTTLAEEASEPPIAPDVAIERALTLLDSFQLGDLDAVEAQLTDDFVLNGGFVGEASGPMEVDDWMGLQYLVAQAVDFADPACEFAAAQTDDGVVVSCDVSMELAVHQRTNTAGEPSNIVITVTEGGITEMTSTIPSFGRTVLGPRDEWIETNRPDAEYLDLEGVGYAAFEREAALEQALLDEWVAFGVDVAEQAFADVDAGDISGFLPLSRGGGDVIGVDAPDAPEAFGALAANGVRFEPSACGPLGIRQQALVIGCDVVITSDALDTAGVDVGGSVELGVGADGIIKRSGSTIDWGPVHDFNQTFETWLASEAPDVHARVTWFEFVSSDDVRSPLAMDPSGDNSEITALMQDFVAASPDYPVEG